MEVLQAQQPLTPEEQTQLEFNALLGAFEDRENDTTLSQEELITRDSLIFNGLKETLNSARAMENISLLQNMSQRLGEIACNHNHFAQQLDNFNVFGEDSHDNQTGFNHTHGHEDESKQDKGEKGKKKKKKKQLRRGWFSITKS